MNRYSQIRGKGFLFLLFLWIFWFFNMSSRTLFSPILPLIEDEFMIRHARASSIFIFLSMGYAISVYFAGYYSGRFGYKKTISLSFIIASLVLFLTSFVKIFSVFYILGFILGFSLGLYLPAALPFITEHFYEIKWGKSIAIHDSAASISIFCTPFIVLFILHFFTWRGVFEVYGVICLISALIFYLINDEVKIASSQKIRQSHLFKSPSLWISIIHWTLATGANLGLYLIVPLYLNKELFLEIREANSILGMSRLGGIGAAILCSLLIDQFSLRRIMFFTLLLAGIFTFLAGRIPVSFIGYCLFLQAIFVTGFFPMGLVAITMLFSKESRSMAIGIILACGIIFGGGVIPYLLGLSGDLLSFRFGISALGVLVILSSLLVLSMEGLERG